MPKSKRKQSLEPIQSKSLEHLWPLGIAPQHSKVPVPKYFPMANPLSSLGAGTFDAKIKEKTVVGTHPEQKFGASLATWHCPPTLKSPRTKISTYDQVQTRLLWPPLPRLGPISDYCMTIRRKVLPQSSCQLLTPTTNLLHQF